ncbi:MAG TPA: TolC family protein [Candidatus Acidoferrales bacterium]|nr:TolC family protein [Candidatus Acidoferrales bacterium]
MKADTLRNIFWIFVLPALVPWSAGAAQRPEDLSSKPVSTAPQQPAAAADPTLRLTLDDALVRARRNSPQFQAALAEAQIAHEDAKQAKDALLPTITYNNEMLYTQGNGTGSVRYIANNAVHEYTSQGNVHEVLSVAGIYEVRRASAGAALARARAEIASRGLVVTVVQSYFGVLAAQSKANLAQKADDEGEQFLKLTQNLERGGEVAHSDVIKAELQAQERKRQLREALLTLLNARLDFAVLLFPDFSDRFVLADDLHASIPLPTLGEVQQQASNENPDVRAALASVEQATDEVGVERAAYLPSLSLDYFYGIDAAQFATNGIFDNRSVPNLGSSAAASLNIPIWNWGATQSRVKQAQIRRAQSARELSFAQRKLLAEIQSLYNEAETALDELAGLQRSADLAGESLKLTTLRYKGGEATVLEVVDAQTTAALAANAYEDGAVRYRLALANLQTLTGAMSTR